ncbi:jg2600 [Pararge aegeria aegeria]|uniref:Jg2600 protein n=1 Tax=Pararge aegeria aegeria TaxID=348720 RepID=A0A8S4S4E1_9NEOP|nr:jg2600 [Pararge aegeria aegeria]
MADGSPEDRAGRTRIEDLTFSASDPSLGDTKKCSRHTSEGVRLKLSFYTELEASESSEESETRGVVADRSAAAASDFRKTPGSSADRDGDDRKKRCFDRYDSSESSDRWARYCFN